MDILMVNPKKTLQKESEFSGNWRDYFLVNESFGPDKPLLEKALDDIVATGKDGADLIMKAYESATANRAQGQMISDRTKKDTGISMPVASGEKIEFHSDGGISAFMGNDSGSHVNMFSSGIINIDPKQTRTIAWKNSDGQITHASLTGVVAHELFHQADPNFRADVRSDPEKHRLLVDKIIVSTTLDYKQKKDVLRAVTLITNDFLGKHINANTPVDNMKAGLEAGIIEFGKYISDHPKEFKAEIAKRANVPVDSFEAFDHEKAGKVLSDFKEKLEDDATKYADVFMAKHFPKEPWRGSYSNTADTTALETPIVREKGCGDLKLGIYHPETISLTSLGNLSQPVIENKPSPFCGVSH